MKIMHINCSDHGSTGKIIMELVKAADERKWESVLCVPKKVMDVPVKTYISSLKYEQAIYKRICYLGGLRYGIAPLSTMKIIAYIRKESPQVVHLHSINCNMVNIYKLLDYLKKNHIPTVVTNHAEFFYTGSCSHANDCEQWIKGCRTCMDVRSATLSKTFDRTHTAWNKMRKAFNGFSHIQIVSVSPWGDQRSKKSGILGHLPNCTIMNGIDTQIFKPITDMTIKKRLGIDPSMKIIVHVTAQFSDDKADPKGGFYILELAKKLKDNVVVIVVGKNNSNNLLPSNVLTVGEILDQTELAKYYSMADLTVITSKRETYSMPVAESLCCGTPVIGFCAGGPESIAIKEYSEFVEYGNMNKLLSVVEAWMDRKEYYGIMEIAQNAKDKYSEKRMTQHYLETYERICLNE